tara:strand:- start:19202 stop:19414 length:213 start_codon:yes stop_codon:yes gene_type:complete
MKRLLLLMALLTYSVASFANGSVICEDRTTVDSVQIVEANSDGSCPAGSVKNETTGQCESPSSGDAIRNQ